MNISLSVILFIGVSGCVINGLSLGNSDPNDYTYGAKIATSTLIAREIISQNKMLLQTSTKMYTLTQAGTPKNIDYIKITDLKRKRGASAEITDGGVGENSVTIKFTAGRGHGIKSQVEIWGT
ncbi:uncharacterized protein LOC117135034 [Drosophila busckii]|uniref:uncharacterized protein LOC117135034 n=1 Tax=Drosophila busckii TaxID=30019 RepID=UPI001432CC70|nr:uncharacterized protein LOC117135034 [Drosophila busckii]